MRAEPIVEADAQRITLGELVEHHRTIGQDVQQRLAQLTNITEPLLVRVFNAFRFLATRFFPFANVIILFVVREANLKSHSVHQFS
jgi:hypothetical protein